MKNLIRFSTLFLAALCFFSCNKSDAPTPTPLTQDTIPKIASVYLPLTKFKAVEYLVYDNQSNLVALRAYSYDSSSGTPMTDSFYIHFTLDGSSSLPAAFDETYYLHGDPPAGKAAHHVLSYDAQNRLTIDSITVSDANDFSVQHYSYDNSGNTIVQWLSGDPATPGSYAVNQIDTMNIQNENLVTDINYSVPDGNLNHLFTRSYSSHLNPFYRAQFARGFGAYLVFNNLFFDFRSRYLPTQFNSQGDGVPAFTLNYLWSVDATGSVIRGVGTEKSTGLVQAIYSFTY